MVSGIGVMSPKARVVDDFPHGVREIEHAWIPLSDGICLAAGIWLPEDAEDNPVPAVVEYIPYCKRCGTSLGPIPPAGRSWRPCRARDRRPDCWLCR